MTTPLFLDQGQAEWPWYFILVWIHFESAHPLLLFPSQSVIQDVLATEKEYDHFLAIDKTCLVKEHILLYGLLSAKMATLLWKVCSLLSLKIYSSHT